MHEDDPQSTPSADAVRRAPGRTDVAPDPSRRALLRGAAAGAGALALGVTAAGASGPARAGAAATSPARARILPRRLEPGMTLGLLSPSSPSAEDDQIAAAIERVESLGFRTRVAPHAYARTEYLAGSDADRAADFNALIRDPQVDALLCIRGGYGAARILPMLDYDAIIAHPKPIVGYSDITALHCAVGRRTGLVTYHGPIAGQNFTDYSWTEFRKVLMQGDAPVRIGAPPPFDGGPGRIDTDNRIVRIAPGVAEGPLVGGNLSLVASLTGTPWAPDFAGAILCLEDVDEAPYRIDRMLTQLWLAGHLQQCAGIVFGKFTDADDDGNTFSVEHVLRDRCAPLGIPVLRGLMFGHVPDQTVLPLGVRARLDADAGTLTLLEAPVR